MEKKGKVSIGQKIQTVLKLEYKKQIRKWEEENLGMASASVIQRKGTLRDISW